MKSLTLSIVLIACHGYGPDCPRLGHSMSDVFPLTADLARSGTYALADDAGAIGVGWVVDEHHIVTAAHVCTRAHGLLRVAPGHVLDPVHVDEKSHLCLLESVSVIGTEMILQDTNMQRADAAFTVDREGRILRGQYLGRNVINLPVQIASIGAPVYTPSGVAGVLIGGRKGHPNQSIIVPVGDTVRDFVEDGGGYWHGEPHSDSDSDAVPLPVERGGKWRPVVWKMGERVSPYKISECRASGNPLGCSQRWRQLYGGLDDSPLPLETVADPEAREAAIGNEDTELVSD